MSTPPGSPRDRAPILVILSGPSGVGKDAVLTRMREQGKPYHFTVTATTRPRRATETDGVDYTFVSVEEFHRMIQQEALLEWAEVYGHLYGVPRAQVDAALEDGQDVMVKTDVQGAATIRRLNRDGVFIFLAPPSMEELCNRLIQRMTESPGALRLRLQTAEAEMEEASKFDYVVTNHDDRIDDTVREIDEIVAKERRLRLLNEMPP